VADIVAEISSSEYAIDDLLSRLTWMLKNKSSKELYFPVKSVDKISVLLYGA